MTITSTRLKLLNQYPIGKYLYTFTAYLLFNRKCNGRWGKAKSTSSSSGQQSDSVFEKFKKLDTRGQSLFHDDDDSMSSDDLSISSATAHQHPISCIRVYSTKGNSISMLSTSALDGKIFLWDISEKFGGNLPSCSISTLKLLNKASKETAG